MTTDSTFFLSYISAALYCSLKSVQTAMVVPDAVREQAWHLLSYGLRMEEAWGQTKVLLLALAPKMEQAGFRGDWLVYLQQGVKSAQQVADLHAEAEIKLYIGQLYRLTSQFAAAREVLNASLATFIHLGDRLGRIRAQNQLASVEWQAHRYEEATYFAEQTLMLCENKDEEVSIERAFSLTVLGLVAKERHRWRDAESYHRRALAIRSELGLVRESAISLLNIGLTLCEQQGYEEGISCYEQALAILTEINDIYHCAVVQMNLGLVFSNQGNYENAILLYQKAELGFRLHQVEHYLADNSTNLAVAHLALKQWRLAENYFLQSINCYKQLENEMWRLLTKDGLAETYLGQQRYSEAQELLLAIQIELPNMVSKPYYGYLCEALAKHLQEAQEGMIYT